MERKIGKKREKIENELAKKELISSINSVILDIENSYENYNTASGDLIDFYAYDIKAKEARYNYLRNELKNLIN